MQGSYRSPIPKELQWRSWASDPEGITVYRPGGANPPLNLLQVFLDGIV